MQLNPFIQATQPAKPITPAVQATLAPAVVAAQATTTQAVRTQTAQATAGVGRTDQPRDSQSGTNTAQSNDTRANASIARSNGGGYRTAHRGMQLNVTV